MRYPAHEVSRVAAEASTMAGMELRVGNKYRLGRKIGSGSTSRGVVLIERGGQVRSEGV